MYDVWDFHVKGDSREELEKFLNLQESRGWDFVSCFPITRADPMIRLIFKNTLKTEVDEHG